MTRKQAPTWAREGVLWTPAHHVRRSLAAANVIFVAFDLIHLDRTGRRRQRTWMITDLAERLWPQVRLASLLRVMV